MAFIGPQRAVQSIIALFKTGDEPTVLPAECQKLESEMSLGGGAFAKDLFQYAMSPADFAPTAAYLVEVFEGTTNFEGQGNLYNAWYSGAQTPVMSQTEIYIRLSSRTPAQPMPLFNFFATHRCLTIAATRIIRAYPTLNDSTGYIHFAVMNRLDRLQDDAFTSSDLQRRVLRSQLTISVQMLEAPAAEGTPGGGQLPPVNLPSY